MFYGRSFLRETAAPPLRLLGVLLAVFWQVHALPKTPLYLSGLVVTTSERILSADIKAVARVAPGEMRARPAASEAALGSDFALAPEKQLFAAAAHSAAIMPCRVAASPSGVCGAFRARAPPFIA